MHDKCIKWKIYLIRFLPDGYNVFRKDRSGTGGGVLVAVRSCHPASDIEIETDCELIWVSVALRNNRKVHLAAFYRPPSAGTEPLEQLHKALTSLHKNTKNPNASIILGGDFNCPHIDWSSNTLTPDCNNKPLHEHLLDLLSDHNLEQMQRDPTRFCNVLDLYCTNRPGLVKYATTIPGVSDHDIIVVDAALKPEFTKKQ